MYILSAGQGCCVREWETTKPYCRSQISSSQAQTERQTERQTDTDRERDLNTETETDTEIDTETERDTATYSEEQRDSQRQINTEGDTETERGGRRKRADRQVLRQSAIQTLRQIGSARTWTCRTPSYSWTKV